MTKLFEVLVWTKYEANDSLGVPQTEKEFDTYQESFDYYSTVEKFLCKIVMEYKNIEADSDGCVIDEEWNEKSIIRDARLKFILTNQRFFQ